jgi:hypothetical protein
MDINKRDSANHSVNCMLCTNFGGINQISYRYHPFFGKNQFVGRIVQRADPTGRAWCRYRQGTIMYSQIRSGECIYFIRNPSLAATAEPRVEPVIANTLKKIRKKKTTDTGTGGQQPPVKHDDRFNTLDVDE